jgi:putative membrane protein
MTESSGNVLVVIVTVVLVLIALPLLWGGMMMGGPMGPWMMGGWGAAAQPGWGPGWGAVSMLFWLLTLAGVGLLAMWAVRRVAPREGHRREPLDILKERYARGDLTREQYEQMRQDLE